MAHDVNSPEPVMVGESGRSLACSVVGQIQVVWRVSNRWEFVNYGDVEVGALDATAVVGPDHVGRLRPQFGRCSPNGSVTGLEGQDRSEDWR